VTGRARYGNPIDGGMDTARSKAPASAGEVAARQAVCDEALAYLVRTGNADVAEALGLVESKRRRGTGNAMAKTCPVCSAQFLPTGSRVQTCSRACAGKSRSHGEVNR
jgi:hypothetical protein